MLHVRPSSSYIKTKFYYFYYPYYRENYTLNMKSHLKLVSRYGRILQNYWLSHLHSPFLKLEKIYLYTYTNNISIINISNYQTILNRNGHRWSLKRSTTSSSIYYFRNYISSLRQTTHITFFLLNMWVYWSHHRLDCKSEHYM